MIRRMKTSKTLGLVVLLLLPTGFESALSYKNADRVDALVLATDESDIVDTGLVRSGEQRCQVRILAGQFKNTECTAVNRLNGSLAEDKLFSPGDRAFVVVSHSGGKITTVYMTDHGEPQPAQVWWFPASGQILPPPAMTASVI